MGRFGSFAKPSANVSYVRTAVVRCVVFARLKSPLSCARGTKTAREVGLGRQRLR